MCNKRLNLTKYNSCYLIHVQLLMFKHLHKNNFVQSPALNYFIAANSIQLGTVQFRRKL